MAKLVSAIEGLQLASEDLAKDQSEGFLSSSSYDRANMTKEEIKMELLKKNFDAAALFDTWWLNRLQSRQDFSADYGQLFELGPTQSRTVIRFTREGLEGRVTGYKEVTVPSSSITAKNSTSILRKPANRADFVRGAAGYLPFSPGGLESIEATATAEDAFLEAGLPQTVKKGDSLKRLIDVKSEGGLLEVPPGFQRGLRESNSKTKALSINTEEVEDILDEPAGGVPLPKDSVDGGVPISEEPRNTGNMNGALDEEDDNDIDSLLPDEFPALAPRSQLLSSSAQRRGKEWAHMVDVNRQMTNFRELVPEMARDWPFELDTFQKEAVYHLENGDSVFVAAHTSAGKTVVAEYAIALAAKHMTKAIYTSPIKALSNQKFRDFQNTFEDVGILTGDVQIRPEASCLIMTTEILRSMLYRGADLIRDVEYVIFDEVHYVNDQERGVVWEEVIIMLPEYVTLILLSATVPNTYEFASWVGRTKKKDIYVISTPKRPIPLQHFLWANKSVHLIVDADKKFIEKGWKEANDVLSGKDKVKIPAQQDNARGRGQGGRGGQQPQRGGQQQRGRGQPAQRGQGNIGRTGRGGGRTTAAQDRTLWVHVVQHLRKEDLLPCCIFVFSKKRCEENADALANLDFCTATEKSAIHMIIEKSLARLKGEDKQLPQIRRMRELLSRGIAVHHGGLLPIVKEMVEILFARTLVKVLFATETFAMGLNLPTRTVVFSGYRKHDGKSFRDLLPGEYTQMAGRAGRRGLDKVGTVIIVAPGAEEAPPAAILRQMITGDPSKLRSQFRLTYNMILNLLRVEALKIEEMIKRSFSENATQALMPENEKKVKLSEADLEKVRREACNVCDQDIEKCHKAGMEFESLTRDFHLNLLASPVGRRMFAPKRLVVYRKDGIRSAGILLREGTSKGFAPTLQVLDIGFAHTTRQSNDVLPYISSYRPFFVPLPQTASDMNLRGLAIPLNDLECVTQTMIKGDPSSVLQSRSEALQLARDELLTLCKDWMLSAWDEVDWSRVKELAVRETSGRRDIAATRSQDSQCIICPNFVKHFGMQNDEWLVKEHIAQLRQLISDQNLQLLPDYQQRISVLKDLGFIDDVSRVELKGKVACEIHSADELVLTELILENTLATYEPEEIAALLSAFVFQEKTDIDPALTASLERGRDMIIALSEKVNHYQTLHQVILSADDSNDFVSKPRFGLVEVVYEWARGMSFNRITDLTDVPEGTIVRVITRLDETCREVRNAARIVGDPTLFQKMQRCQELIKRDICATASLYM